MPDRPVKSVLQEHTDRLMSFHGVVGVGVGEQKGQPCIKVFVVKKTPSLVEQIPSELDGYPVATQEAGEFQALDDR